ncbi:MAG: ATP-binding protein [Ignavibacteriaceae bacterium]|nr:ATP-binding protein [Ignavibacteriaceae bacterium]
MKYIPRKIDSELLKWKEENDHKPLLIRGARQVGKTKTIREFGKTFENFIEVNFEESPSVRSLFEGDLSPAGICENLSAIYRTAIIPGKTLLFFDEIQSCQNAIASLRYFYEKMPGLHLISAGSLLEFALSEIPTFGVGRIRSLFLYPLGFSEFLIGMGEENLLGILEKASSEAPLPDAVHQKLLGLVRKFMLVGGMPQAAAEYIESGDINKCQALLTDLTVAFRTDFAKYKKRFNVSLLQEVFQSVIAQAGGKFVYSAGSANANHSQIKTALSLLITAGLVIPVTHTAANGLPLGAEANPKRQKMLLLDTGLFQRAMGLDLSEFLTTTDFEVINKGNLAEQFVGLELIKTASCYEPPELFYWHREAKSSNAEVDFVIRAGGKIVPVEVKSGGKGSMKSLHIFMKEKKCERGIRFSAENFSRYGAVETIPLYAVESIRKIS